jgi:hypothetical protein
MTLLEKFIATEHPSTDPKDISINEYAAWLESLCYKLIQERRDAAEYAKEHAGQQAVFIDPSKEHDYGEEVCCTAHFDITGKNLPSCKKCKKCGWVEWPYTKPCLPGIELDSLHGGGSSTG